MGYYNPRDLQMKAGPLGKETISRFDAYVIVSRTVFNYKFISHFCDGLEPAKGNKKMYTYAYLLGNVNMGYWQTRGF